MIKQYIVQEAETIEDQQEFVEKGRGQEQAITEAQQKKNISQKRN